MNYREKIEKQNEKLKRRLIEAETKAEKFDYFSEVLSRRLMALNKKILDLYNTDDPDLVTYKKNIESCYEEERKWILALTNDIETKDLVDGIPEDIGKAK